jgi:hypothetical protein
VRFEMVEQPANHASSESVFSKAQCSFQHANSESVSARLNAPCICITGYATQAVVAVFACLSCCLVLPDVVGWLVAH